MNNIIDNIEYKGYNIELMYDESPEDPLTWSTPDDRGVWYALKHSRNVLPYEIEADTDDYDSWSELARAVTGKGGELPGHNYRFVRWYEHSGVSITLRDDEGGQGFDAGIAGVVFGPTTEDIDGDFDIWKQYVEGEVYGYNITDPNGDDLEWGSLWGFYGLDHAVRSAEEMIDSDLSLRPSERPKKVAMAASGYHK